MEKIGAIFDCDGTLLDSMGLWRELEAELGRRAGATVSPQDTEVLCTLTIPETASYFHEHFGLGRDADEVERMIDDYVMDYYCRRAEARPGSLAFVQELAERGVVLSVASSSPQPYLQAGLAHAGFSPYLVAIVSVEDVGASKREALVYDRARELMGTVHALTWGFEDSLYAVRTLSQAGYGVVGIYDRDDSGSFAELSVEANLAFRSFEDMSADAFCEAVRTRAVRLL